ncbi:MAG: enoyl-CoA hydratase/isomerase family protein [Candidatus Dormibacteria bacterium]
MTTGTATAYELLDITRDGRVATVTMHREGNNGIAPDLVAELVRAFDELEADREVWVVVLASAYEKYFSVGADLKGLATVDREGADAKPRLKSFIKEIQDGFNRVERFPRLTIAAIGGHALGGGCELSMCCDLRVMVDDGRALIGQTEIALGVIPGAGGTQRLPRLVGRSRALQYMVEGTRLRAPEAHSAGLVHHVFGPERFAELVREYAQGLAKQPPLAVEGIKRAVQFGVDRTLEEGLDVEADGFAACALSEDAVIGIMSFLSKQEPEFKGR